MAKEQAWLLVLVSVFPQLFFALMGGNLSQFSLSSTGHSATPWYQNKEAAQAAQHRQYGAWREKDQVGGASQGFAQSVRAAKALR